MEIVILCFAIGLFILIAWYVGKDSISIKLPEDPFFAFLKRVRRNK